MTPREGEGGKRISLTAVLKVSRLNERWQEFYSFKEGGGLELPKAAGL